ncbi:hypothetical protein D1007_34945 [Hordeum vulgare]|nr:hypothetical protein D1007_34945 [Hordeum vulgare]
MEVPVQSRVRRDRERVLIDAATVEGIKKRRKVVADGHESEDEENRTDHTMLQYCSDDEENRSGHRVPGFDEPPLTEYEKVRARNMMRNNRIFRSLGIDAIASMIRKTIDVQQGTNNGVQEGSGVISDDPEYNPKEDEIVVHKTVKALKESRTKRPGVKKTASKNRKSSEAFAAMPPGRVMGPPRGQTKRILEPDEPDRVTRQKSTMAAVTDHQESPLGIDFESWVEMHDEFSPMDEETTLCMDESGSVCVPLRRGARSIDRNDVANFEINTDSETIKYACKDVLQKSSKNRRHNIKNKYFDTVGANKVSTKSPVPDLTDGEWQAVVQMWSTPRHKETCVSNKINREKVVYQQRTGSRHYTAHIFATKEERKGEELSAIDLFKATHNSKKHGFSEPVKIAILEMEKMKDAPIPEGEEPKSDAEIVEEVLKTEVNQSTFLRNKLERSELQDEVMQEEMAAIKLKAEEYEATRDLELELLRKKSQEQEEKLAHLMALFGAKAL